MEPGEGAIEYAKALVAGLNREQAAIVLRKESVDPRVKRCDFCRYRWRDVSLRNTRRTCCDRCKTDLKTQQTRQRRADKALLTGKTKKKTKREIHYVWWLEYPFWINEYEMLKQTWKQEIPHDTDLIDFVEAQVKIYGPGNRQVESRVAEI